VTANNQPSLTGAATAGSLVTVYIDGSAVGTTTADGTGAWQYDVATPLQDGAYGTRHRDRYRRQRQYGVHALDLYGGHRRTSGPDRDCADRRHRYRRQRQ
jgi:hypothetical protein